MKKKKKKKGGGGEDEEEDKRRKKACFGHTDLSSQNSENTIPLISLLNSSSTEKIFFKEDLKVTYNHYFFLTINLLLNPT